jgi:hypothetical protein
MQPYRPPQPPERQASALCVETGCSRPARTYSRFCTNHARRVFRTGDPNGRVFRKGELKQYREIAQDHLELHAGHPAVVAAEAYMRSLVLRTDVPADLRNHLKRLYDEGAAPRRMLVESLAVDGLAFYMAGAYPQPKCLHVNRGLRVLHVVPMARRHTRSGRNSYPVRVLPKTSLALGQILADDLGAFPAQFWESADRRLRAALEPRKAIRAALEAVPFPDQPPRAAHDEEE